MIDKKDFIIIGLVAVLVVGGVLYMSEKVSADYLLMLEEVNQTAYGQGFQDATLLINTQIISSLVQDGYITIMFPINETAVTPVRLGVMQ